MKATYGEVDEKPIQVCKDTITDNGVKKSGKDLLCVNKDMSLSEAEYAHLLRRGRHGVLLH